MSPDLVTRTKHRAIDEQLSLSDFVANLLTSYLKGTELKKITEAGTQDGTGTTEHSVVAGAKAVPDLKLQPMIHVEDMAASIKFYEALGATIITGSCDGDWAQMRLGGAEISLLAHPANPEQNEGQVELNFEYGSSLSELQEQLENAGVKIARGAGDEAFGEQLQLEAPGGMLIKINRLDPATFT